MKPTFLFCVFFHFLQPMRLQMEKQRGIGCVINYIYTCRGLGHNVRKKYVLMFGCPIINHFSKVAQQLALISTNITISKYFKSNMNIFATLILQPNILLPHYVLISKTTKVGRCRKRKHVCSKGRIYTSNIITISRDLPVGLEKWKLASLFCSKEASWFLA